MKNIDHHKLGIHDPQLCGECFLGTCCREGVETDLFEAAEILKIPLSLAKPWFKYLRRDRRFPSGFVFATLLKKRRCIFQDDAMRCMIYAYRPRFCREFPLEDGRRAPQYHEICHLSKKKAGKKRR